MQSERGLAMSFQYILLVSELVFLQMKWIFCSTAVVKRWANSVNPRQGIQVLLRNCILVLLSKRHNS